MSVVVSLLRAIDRADGEALVMHVGEKPYVVTATGHAELAANALTVPAMTGMLEQLLPADSRQALNELGAVEYHLPADEASPGVRYSVVAARGGDDIWIEVRRRKQPAQSVAVRVEPPAPPEAAPPVTGSLEPAISETSARFDEPSVSEPLETEPEPAVLQEPAAFEEPSPVRFEEAEPPVFADPAAFEDRDSGLYASSPVRYDEGESAGSSELPSTFESQDAAPPEPPERQRAEEPSPAVDRLKAVPVEQPMPVFGHRAAAREPEASRGFAVPENAGGAEATPELGGPGLARTEAFRTPSVDESGAPHAANEAARDTRELGRAAFESRRPEPEAAGRTSELADAVRASLESARPASRTSPAAPPEEHRFVVRDEANQFELRVQTEDDFYGDAGPAEDVDAGIRHVDEPAPSFDFTREAEAAPAAPHRVGVQAEGAPPTVASGPSLVSPAPPPAAAPAAGHVDPLHRLLRIAAGQGASALYVAPQSRPSLRVDGEMRVLDELPMTSGQLESELRSLVAPEGAGEAALPLGEFETRELHGVGRVQCLLFRDHRGLGAIFRMLPGRTVSAQKAGLSPGIQSLCTEPEGLLLVAGAPGSGKSTLVAALVDQVNRTRRDHIITVESDIQFVHENQTSFISQREARDEERFLEAVRAAIREAPDALVVDGDMNAEIASTVLEAAASRLVVVSLAAATTAAALERFIGLVGGDAGEARALVSEHLRGVIMQALLRKTGGGRAAAREVLVNVPSVAALIANAQLGQLASVLTSGRRIGMVPLNDALLELVQGGALDVRQAYRKSPDQGELVTMLNKAGFDTTFAEHLG